MRMIRLASTMQFTYIYFITYTINSISVMEHIQITMSANDNSGEVQTPHVYCYIMLFSN